MDDERLAEIRKQHTSGYYPPDESPIDHNTELIAYVDELSEGVTELAQLRRFRDGAADEILRLRRKIERVEHIVRTDGKVAQYGDHIATMVECAWLTTALRDEEE